MTMCLQCDNMSTTAEVFKTLKCFDAMLPEKSTENKIYIQLFVSVLTLY